MSDLTKRQEIILNIIKDGVTKKGYPPSVREICAAVGLSSSATVHKHLQTLEQKGYIRRDPTKPRAIEILDADESVYFHRVRHVPILGRVAAGAPVLAEENIEDTFPVPQDMLGADDAFILRVRGESMIEAGILDGDLVLVRPQNTARNGEIVVAMLDEEAVTVKRYFRERDTIRLQPENSSMTPIYSRIVMILGVVTGLFRTVI
ncbi:MAG: transcriptional repressor LexA [Gracilibacteraceae bacterium]|jgi:repressor LexA|nr:transcriptional repressor LexA [Gracilibacteraceae bacterium]